MSKDGLPAPHWGCDLNVVVTGLAQSTRSLATISQTSADLNTAKFKLFWRGFAHALGGTPLWKESTLLVLCWMVKA